MAKPGNALGVSVLNLPVAADAVIAAGIVTIEGIPPLAFRDLVGFQTTAFTAGVLQADTLTLTTPVVGQAYKIVIRANQKPLGVAEMPDGKSKTYIVIASTTSISDLVTQFTGAINNDLSAFVDATANTNDLELVQKGGFTIDGYSIPDSPVVPTSVTAFTKPQGSPTEVESFVDKSVTVDAGGQFKKYVITIHNRKEFDSAGDVSAQKLVAIIFADETAGDFAAFNTALTDIMTAEMDDTSTITLKDDIRTYLEVS